jgi:hypothetical protein
MGLWSNGEWPAERAQRAETPGNNQPAGFINDIKRLSAPMAAGSVSAGRAETGGNRRKLPEVMDTDAFRAGGMGVAAMQYG